MGDLVPIVVFGFDYNKSNTKVGPGTALRCLEAIDLYRRIWQQEGKDAMFIVSPARAPGVTAERQPKTMAQMMIEFISEAMGETPRFEFGAAAWGTRGELLEASRVILRLRRQRWDVAEAYLVSNREHLFRIRVLAFWLAVHCQLPWQWRSSAAQWNLQAWTMKERVKEHGKFFVELARSFWWRPPI